MKKIKLFFCVCLTCVSASLLTAYAGNNAKMEVNNVVGNDYETTTVQMTNSEEITLHDFKSGYAKYLEKYDDNGNGGYRKDIDYHLFKVMLDYNNENYICWFRVHDSENKETVLSQYRTEFDNIHFETKQRLEEYLDSLLRDDIIALYTCTDDNYQASDEGVYTSSYILE